MVMACDRLSLSARPGLSPPGGEIDPRRQPHIDLLAACADREWDAAGMSYPISPLEGKWSGRAARIMRQIPGAPHV